jgi:CheY-like chemotaxis protein
MPLSVVLMDLEMPVMDGLACVRRIREMQAEGTMSRVPVIAVTANARSDQISGAMEAGMVSFCYFASILCTAFGCVLAGLVRYRADWECRMLLLRNRFVFRN